MQLTGNTIFITGGTSGIGRALAEQFHKRGNQVIVSGRRQHLLDEITAANPGMAAIVLDAEQPSSIDNAAADLLARFPDINVLVNNAGTSGTEDYLSPAHDTVLAQSIVQTNILSVIQLTSALLPTLLRQPRAAILTTTSGLAFVPLAALPTYCASKAFLHTWLQSLRFQLRETPVEVLELIPPYVRTHFGGSRQAADPQAMPLEDFIAETMDLLGRDSHPAGEILGERASRYRIADTAPEYEQAFAQTNRFQPL